MEDKNKTIIYPEGSYGGEALDHILTLTYNDNELYEHGLIHVETGVKYKLTLPTSLSGRVIQEAQATPTVESGRSAGGAGSFNSYTIHERTLEPNHFGIFKLWNPEVMASYWRQFAPRKNQLFRELAPDVQADFLNQLTQKKNEEIGEALWVSVRGGVSALSTVGYTPIDGVTPIGVRPEQQAVINEKFDGIMARLIRSAVDKDPVQRINVAGTAKLETGEAIEKAFYKMYKSIPDALRSKAKSMSFLVSWEQWFLYDEYLTSKAYKYKDNSTENARVFKNIKIIPIHGCPEHTIILGRFTKEVDSNFWMAIDWGNPTDEELMSIGRFQNYSSEWFVKMHFKMDFNIVRPSELSAWSYYFKDLTLPTDDTSTGEDEGEGND